MTIPPKDCAVSLEDLGNGYIDADQVKTSLVAALSAPGQGSISARALHYGRIAATIEASSTGMPGIVDLDQATMAHPSLYFDIAARFRGCSCKEHDDGASNPL